MGPVLADREIGIELREVELSPEEIAQSNEVLIDGTPVDGLVQGEISVSVYPSCGDLVGGPCACRTVRVTV